MGMFNSSVSPAAHPEMDAPTSNGTDMSVSECTGHPLGMFDSISTLAVASNMRELYRLVLVDTPLAPYFAESLTSGKSHTLSSITLQKEHN